jgi:hypothetical protein
VKQLQIAEVISAPWNNLNYRVMKKNLLRLFFFGLLTMVTVNLFAQFQDISKETFPNSFNTPGTLGNDGSFTGSIGPANGWSITSSNIFDIEVDKDPRSGTNNALRFKVDNANASPTIANNIAVSPIINMKFGNCQPSSARLSFQLFPDDVEKGNGDFSFGVQFFNGTTWVTEWSATANNIHDNYNQDIWNTVTLNIPTSYWGSNFRYRFYATKNPTTITNNHSTDLWVDNATISINTLGGNAPNFSDATITEIIDAGGGPDGVYEVGDVYKFDNVITAPSNVYAEVKIEAMVNATITSLDNNAAGVAQRFQPSIRPTGLGGSDKEGYVQFAITFKKTSDNSVVKLEGLTYRHFDVDGSSNPSYTFRETGWVTGHSSLLVNSPSGLESGGAVIDGGYTWTKVLGELREHNGITSDPDVYFTTTYGPISVVRFRLGYKYEAHDGGASYNSAPRAYGTEFGCFDLRDEKPLPEKFLIADRQRVSNVGVTPTTASEQNSKRFTIQRK